MVEHLGSETFEVPHRLETAKFNFSIQKHWILILIFNISLGIFFTSVQASPSQSITPISVNNQGEFGNADSIARSISGDGRFIIFTSQANNLIDTYLNKDQGLCVFDRLTKEMFIPIESAAQGKISPDGRFLIYKIKNRADRIYLDDLYQHTTSSIFDEFNGKIKIDDVQVSGISNDGRYALLYLSKESQTSNESGSFFHEITLYDRLTNYRRFITEIKTTGGNKGDGLIISTLSEDGRTLAYHFKSYDRNDDEISPEIHLYNRVLDQSFTLRLLNSVGVIQQNLIDLDLNENGDILAYLFRNIKESGEVSINLVIREIMRGIENKIFSYTLSSDNIDITNIKMALSDNGEHVLITYGVNGGDTRLSRVDRITHKEEIIDQGKILADAYISSGGKSILYTKEISGVAQVFLWEESIDWSPSHIIAGQVTNSKGTPLTLVTIKDEFGNSAQTDVNGYFWVSDIPRGDITLKASKDGFSFDPQFLSLDVQSDIRDLKIIYAHDEVLKEAALDIGMPYSRDRGMEGIYHGHSAGYCTDLILDSFTWGADFNIQFALEMDYKANPWHFYRWRDARDANDMWRYFSYSGQMMPHESDYLPGDIVFFDWSEDGEIDHVALISEVDYRNRPETLIDATGVINSNPSGLAAELPWEPFHEATVRGFARWSGRYEPIIQGLPEGYALQFSIGGSNLEVRILDSKGTSISALENEYTTARFADLIWEQTISIMDIQTETLLLGIIRNLDEKSQPYHFTAQFIKDGLVEKRIEYKGVLVGNEITRFPIQYQPENINGETLFTEKASRKIEGLLQIY